MKTYSELLRDPRWQRKRLEVLAAADWQCVRCSAADKTLNVHHRRYIKGRKPWEYEAAELEALCQDCHADHHEAESRFQSLLATVPAYWLPSVSALVAGYLCAHVSPNGQHDALEDAALQVVAGQSEAFVSGVALASLGMLRGDTLRAIGELVAQERTSDPALPLSDTERLFLTWLQGGGVV